MENHQCPYNCKSGRLFNPELRIWQDCPHCAGVLSELTSATPSEEAEELRDMLHIPDMYKAAPFYINKFFEPSAFSIFAQSTFETVLSQLNLIERTISEGSVLNESCYFYVGIYADSLGYVYHVLQSAVKHGLSAVPYVSLLDLQGIRANTPHTARIYKGISYYDYTTADVCFVSATASVDVDEAAILADLLMERARHGLATQVFGYWSSTSLKKSKNGLHYLIHESKRLAALHPYEIKTKARLEAEYAQGKAPVKQGSLAAPMDVGRPIGTVAPINGAVNTSPPSKIGGIMLDKLKQEGQQ